MLDEQQLLGVVLVLAGCLVLFAWLFYVGRRKPDHYEMSLAELEAWKAEKSAPKPPRPRSFA